MNKRVILLETALILGVINVSDSSRGNSSGTPVDGEAHVGSRDVDPSKAQDSPGAPGGGPGSFKRYP